MNASAFAAKKKTTSTNATMSSSKNNDDDTNNKSDERHEKKKRENIEAAHHGHVHAASCPCVTKEHTPPHALASLPVKIPALRPENSRHDCF